jgi:hypothetical protein
MTSSGPAECALGERVSIRVYKTHNAHMYKLAQASSTTVRLFLPLRSTLAEGTALIW